MEHYLILLLQQVFIDIVLYMILMYTIGRDNLRWNLIMELTFNLRELEENILKNINKKIFERYLNTVKIGNRKYLTNKEKEEFLSICFRIKSTDIRKFLEKTFGLNMSIDYSSNRNRLNEMISKIVETKRGKTTILNYSQYKLLISSEEFNRFILDNYRISEVSEIDKLYEEVSYLQMHSSILKKEIGIEKDRYINNMSNIFAIVDVLADKEISTKIRSIYKLSFDLASRNMLGNTESQEYTLLEILSDRLNRTSRENVYSDIRKVSDSKIIEYLFEDIDKWIDKTI